MEQLLRQWNVTQKDYDLSKCIHELFEEQAAKTPNAIALIFKQQKLTYQELNQRANQIADHLQKLGVKPETLVGICVERSLLMVIGLLGILKAGGAYVPIDPGYPHERLSYMIKDSQMSILLTQTHLVKILPQNQAEIICLDEFIFTEELRNLNSGVTSNNLIYVIYTSGSTGKPKGVMNTHKGVCNRLLWMQETYQLTYNDVVLQKTPFSFDVSVWEFFWTLISGATLAIAKPGGHKDSNYLVNLIVQEQVTTVHFVPSMLQIFLQAQELEHLKCLKRVFCSGEALPISLQQRFFERLNCELHNLYGPTEAAIDVTHYQCQPNSKLKTVPIGKAIANIQIAKEVEIHHIPGNHYTFILEPHIQVLAESLKMCLKRGKQGLSTSSHKSSLSRKIW